MKNLLIVPLVILFSTLQTSADSKASAKHLNVELVAERSSVKPGDPLEIGIKFNLESEWHVYWINPGDSGEAPRVTWALPEGFIAGDIQWPQPMKITVGPLADYGYAKEVLLMTSMATPKNISSSNIKITAQVKWLVCREVCIPGKADLSLTLPVSKSQGLMSNPLFAETRKTIPQFLPSDWSVKATSTHDSFVLKISGPEKISSASFFPLTTMQIDSPSEQVLNNQELTIKKNEQLVKDPSSLNGLLKVGTHSFVIDALISTAPVAATSNSSLLSMILFAFFGGILLNLMPCVFPVLSMKVFGFLKMTGAESKKIRKHALVYTLGILVSFWVLVGALLVLKSTGEKLGWGFQLQSPSFVAALSSVLFLFGLNLVGVFEISGSFTGMGNSLARKEGYIGAFFTGVLATIVSTPCTAPFMGTAVGFALSQSTLVSFVIFSSLALGLASPYVLLSYSPTVGRMLPRPGPWMDTLKQVTGFLIFATVIWLVSVVALQTAPTYLITVLGGLLLMAVASWLLRRWSEKTWARCFAFLFILLSLALSLQANPNTKQANANGSENGLKWEAYSPANVEKFRAAGNNVFVDFTAAWCISCRVNELVVFGSSEVRKKLAEHKIILVRADWTSHDEVITQALTDLDRSGVPTYAIYEANSQNKPVLLPEVITPGIVITALDKLK